MGIVRLQNITLPQGSRVTLEVLPQATTAAQQPVASLLPAPLPELARQWTSLQQIASLLAVRPDAAPLPWSPLTQPAQPADATPAPQQLSSGLMFFVAALRGGDFRNWLGESNVRWLQQNGHDGLVKKAEAEFFTLARAFTDVPVSQHWQSVFFPVAVDGQLQQVRLFLKRDRKQGRNEQGKKEDDTRFIVEVSMSQLGELQMDGFVRRQPEHQVEFDLYVRSLVPLEPQVQQDIVAIYNSVGELTGYRGSLVFQAVKEFPVNPMKEAMEATGGVVA